MLLLTFDPAELDNCNTVKEVFKVFGIGQDCEIKWTDETVFGKKGYYQNTFITQRTYERAKRALERKKVLRKHPQNTFEWFSFSPMSNGPRYERMEEKLRWQEELDILPDNMIAIFTPCDEEYVEAPEVENG